MAATEVEVDLSIFYWRGNKGLLGFYWEFQCANGAVMLLEQRFVNGVIIVGYLLEVHSSRLWGANLGEGKVLKCSSYQ